MFREIGALIIILMTSSGVIAQTLECGAFSTQTDHGRYGDAIEVNATRSNVTPALGAEYVVAGGRCNFSPYIGTPGQPDPNAGIVINWEKPIDGNDGFSCKAKTLDQNGYILTSVTLYACRIVIKPIEQQQPSLLAPTNVFVIARRGHGIKKRFSYDYRVCNSDASSMLNVRYSHADARRKRKNPQIDEITIGPGKCVELGAKSYIHVQSGTNPQQSVFYERFPAGTFPVVYPPPVSLVSDRPTTVTAPGTPPDGSPEIAPVSCAPIPDAKRGRDEPTFTHYCKLPVSDWGHYRVCFGKEYVELRDGRRESWPYKYMVVAINEKPNSRPGNIATDGTDPRFNATNPETCRDYYDVNSAILLLVGGPPPWNPENIKSIHMSISPISGK